MTERDESTLCASDAMHTSAEEAREVQAESEETYRIMADAMPQIVWSAQATGFRDYFNQRWYEHTNLSVSQTKGWGWLMALHEEDRDACRHAWKQAATLQDTFEYEYRLFCAEDQSWRWQVERALPVFDPQGNVIKWFGSCTDIHALKHAQAEIEALNARLRQAMTETHHRVKNNLQIIAAMVDMQLMSSGPMVSTEELKRLNSHIQALAAVHDILTREAKEEGAHQLVSLEEILDKLLPVHQHTTPRCQILARIEDVQLPGRQGTALALVVNELISNAIKHGNTQVEIVVAQQEAYITVSVCDDGPGFPEGFDVRTAANTGLELVDNLTRVDLQGQVRFSNQPQGGAQVTLLLPARKLRGRT